MKTGTRTLFENRRKDAVFVGFVCFFIWLFPPILLLHIRIAVLFNIQEYLTTGIRCRVDLPFYTIVS